MVQKRDFQSKKALSTSQSVYFRNSHLPTPKSVCSGGRTLTSPPKFIGWIDNQIFLAMGLRSHMLRALVELRYYTIN